MGRRNKNKLTTILKQDKDITEKCPRPSPSTKVSEAKMTANALIFSNSILSKPPASSPPCISNLTWSSQSTGYSILILDKKKSINYLQLNGSWILTIISSDQLPAAEWKLNINNHFFQINYLQLNGSWISTLNHFFGSITCSWMEAEY